MTRRTVVALGVVTAAGCGGAANDAAPAATPAGAPATSASAASSGAAPAPPAKDGCQGVGRLSSERYDMGVVALPDGRVLFIGGGLHERGGPRAEVDEYDPKTNAVTRFATLVHGRIQPGAAVLADGSVVVVGGLTDEDKPGSSIEVYEPAKKAFREVPATLKSSVESPFAIPMKDGRVLMGGGFIATMRGSRPFETFVFDPKTEKLAPVQAPPWPITGKMPYTVAAGGAITVTGGGRVDALGAPKQDCETVFDPASGAWTDTKRCHDLPDVTPYRAANGAPGTAGYAGNALKAYRNGAWETVMTAPSKATGAGLFDGITLDAHHAVASDGYTHEVVRCTF